MTLEEYLDHYGIKRVKYAKKCGLTYRTFLKALRGGNITYKTARSIVDNSEGNVSFQELSSKDSCKFKSNCS